MNLRKDEWGQRARSTALTGVAVGGAVVGLIEVVAAARPGQFAIRAVTAMGIHVVSRPHAAMFGLGTLAIARGLSRHRFAALWAAAMAVIIGGLFSLHGHRDRLVLLGLALVVLTVSRDRFGGGIDRQRLRQLAWVSAGLLGVVTIVRVLAMASAGHTARPHLSTVMAAGAVAIIFVALAPDPPPGPGNTAERLAVRRLVEHSDADSLAPFATRLDRSYVFSPSGGAAIAYRVVLGTALCAGDPVGDPAEARSAMVAFLALCARHGWRPGVLGAGPSTVGVWRELGLRGLVVGDEAVLDPATFALASRRMRNVRQAVSRSINAGVDVHIGPFPVESTAELDAVLHDWLGDRKLRGFSMNLDEILTPRPDVVMATARTADGELVAFARFLRCGDGSVLTLDIAPRSQRAPNGTVERLVVTAVDYARTHGAREMSLNFAGLRRVFESDARSARIATILVRPLDRWIDVRRLYLFCAKFQPEWRPRSLLMGSWLTFAAVATAAMLAELRPTRPVAAPTGTIDATQPLEGVPSDVSSRLGQS
jgi:lysylphosphatidylglycerol synthetase-like protein (DUF2156 family)